MHGRQSKHDVIIPQPTKQENRYGNPGDRSGHIAILRGKDIPTKGIWIEKREDKRIRWWHIPKDLKLGETTSVKIYEPTPQDMLCKHRRCVASLDIGHISKHGLEYAHEHTYLEELNHKEIYRQEFPSKLQDIKDGALAQEPNQEPNQEPEYEIKSMDEKNMVVAKRGGFFTFLIRDFTPLGGNDLSAQKSTSSTSKKPSLATLSSRLFSYACPLVLFLILVITSVLICHVAFGQWAAVGGIVSNIALFSLFFLFGISLL